MTTTETTTDPHLGPLTARQADRLITLAIATCRRLGFDLEYDAGALLPAILDPDAPGPMLGLTNLARAIAQQEPGDWPQFVDTHFIELLRRLDEGAPAPPSNPASELIQRLVPRTSLPPNWVADRPDIIPGLLSVPATVHDDTVTMYLDPTDLGLTWSAAEALGLANLRRRTGHLELLEADGIQLARLAGDSFTASRALVLDTVLHETLGLAELPSAVLAAVPARDLLLIHVIRDLTALPALGLMLHLTAKKKSV
ncbi:hypothetical protein E1263_23575 [Kribbella antibiotica]|uniref:Uncharacterized protein n=1 Tax=Kribbella antibiotica TaxID=190195 RepID=A0A4R4ZHC0_9ACTN|nr:hypothetical protein [Kribbella antibiotica]TDD57436.1 hypothetical protein E1263_23575 [Kribbella antibiotica]